MGKIKSAVCLLLAVSLIGCGGINPRYKEVAAKVGYRVIDLFQVASDTIVQVVVARAASPQDATDGANWLDSAANGLRSLETSSGGLVTASDVGLVVRQFTDPRQVHWSELAEEFAASFDRSSLPSNEALETLAMAANTQAATLRASK